VGFSSQAQAVVLLLLGGAVLRVSVTGEYLRYVRQGLRPLLILAGLLLIATAVMTLWYDLRSPRRGALAEQDGGQDSGHSSSHHEPRVGWLLILPVVALILVAPPALGSYSAAQSGSVLVAQGDGSDYAPLPSGDPVPVAVLDYASRAVYDGGRTLTGHRLRLTGFITTGAQGDPVLARIVLSCCAADGRPVKVALSGDAPVGIPADTWVTVQGTYDPQTVKDPVNEAIVPYLKVTSWQQTPEPAQPYE
jgi:uncharacterized repeat protein (TIGR03943 family)